MPRCVIKVIQGQRLSFSRLRYKNLAFSCSKGSNKHHFSGYASSFPRLFGHYPGRNNAANMFVQCHDVSLRLSKGSVNRFLACNIQIKSSRTQKDLLCTILGVKRASFPRLFGHYSGQNDAANKFVRCHDMSLRLSKGSINHFYVSIIKYVCPRALKIQLCTIFRGRTDRHFRGLFAIIRGETALQLCLHNARLGHKVRLGSCEPFSSV